ncbi:MAG: hypothetical protein AVDCRST_MAG39-1552, partial [uncultured Sphingomonadaceae bacterium]
APRSARRRRTQRVAIRRPGARRVAGQRVPGRRAFRTAEPLPGAQHL